MKGTATMDSVITTLSKIEGRNHDGLELSNVLEVCSSGERKEKEVKDGKRLLYGKRTASPRS